MHVLSIFGAIVFAVVLAGYAAAFLSVLVLRALTAVVVTSAPHATTRRHRLPAFRLPVLRRGRPAPEPQLRTT